MTDEPLYGAEEVAAAAGVTSQTLQNWRARGIATPSGFTAGGHARYTREDFATVMRVAKLRDMGVRLDMVLGIEGIYRAFPVTPTGEFPNS